MGFDGWKQDIRGSVPEDKKSNIKGVKVPMTGITLCTWPNFKTLNIRYAPRVQNKVEAEAKAKTDRVGSIVKGRAKIAKMLTALK